MSALPQSFIDSMLGRIPESPRAVPTVPVTRGLYLPRTAEPTKEVIARVDARLRAEGIYLSYRTLIAETNDALWEEERRRSR